MNKIFIMSISVISFFTACQTQELVSENKMFVSRTIGHTNGCWLTDYSPAKNSKYILPYPIGKSYGISQGNCGRYTHMIVDNNPGIKVGDLRYAYDFSIPTGEEIVAAREGLVVNVEQSFPNSTNLNSHTNYLVVKHDDLTYATYIHLAPKGILVNHGDAVAQGQVIAIAGNSGYTGGMPHLHFQVFESQNSKCLLESSNIKQPQTFNISGCKTIPITFSNAVPLDSPLIEGKSYKAN